MSFKKSNIIFDSEAIENSTNAITSGGVFEALKNASGIPIYKISKRGYLRNTRVLTTGKTIYTSNDNVFVTVQPTIKKDDNNNYISDIPTDLFTGEWIILYTDVYDAQLDSTGMGGQGEIYGKERIQFYTGHRFNRELYSYGSFNYEGLSIILEGFNALQGIGNNQTIYIWVTCEVVFMKKSDLVDYKI